MLEFMPQSAPRLQKKKGKKGRPQMSGCSDAEAAENKLHSRPQPAEAPVEDVYEKMAKMALVPATEADIKLA